jgi:hypothetical protein
MRNRSSDNLRQVATMLDEMGEYAVLEARPLFEAAVEG